jgi:hypothetical protein
MKKLLKRLHQYFEDEPGALLAVNAEFAAALRRSVSEQQRVKTSGRLD